MKITQRQLKQIIKEEVEKTLNEKQTWVQAVKLVKDTCSYLEKGECIGQAAMNTALGNLGRNDWESDTIRYELLQHWAIAEKAQPKVFGRGGLFGKCRAILNKPNGSWKCPEGWMDRLAPSPTAGGLAGAIFEPVTGGLKGK
jgi:hypothetical protein